MRVGYNPHRLITYEGNFPGSGFLMSGALPWPGSARISGLSFSSG